MNLVPFRWSWRHREMTRIHAACAGWSTRSHFKFFERILRDPAMGLICVLGVYEGRDIATLSLFLHARSERDWSIVGVDKFSSEPGADWPDDKRHLSWEEAGFGAAPELERARANLSRLGLVGGVTLVRSDGAEFLRRTIETFDFICLDTSHDYETTVDQIQAALARLAPGGWMGGDDYSDEGTWGVRSAVRDCFRNVREYPPCIWLARRADYTRKRLEQ